MKKFAGFFFEQNFNIVENTCLLIMKKIILTVSLLVFIIHVASAQTDHNVAVSIGPDIAFPFRGAAYRSAVGFAATIEIPVAQQLKLIFDPGYTIQVSIPLLYTSPCPTCTVPTGPSNSGLYKYIPLRAGLRYYPLKHIYINGEAGEAIKVGYGAVSSFIYSIGSGAVIPFNPHNGIDLGLSFERGNKNNAYNSNYNSLNQLGIRLAYRYKF